MVVRLLTCLRSPWPKTGKLDPVTLGNREDSSPQHVASFACSKCWYWRKGGIAEWERHVLTRPPQNSSGKKVGLFLPTWQTSVLYSIFFYFLVFCVVRLFLKEQNLVQHNRTQALLFFEAHAFPLPAISLLRSKFPFIKIKHHFLLLFSCFPQQNWM